MRDIAAAIIIILFLVTACTDNGLDVCYSADGMWNCVAIKLGDN